MNQDASAYLRDELVLSNTLDLRALNPRFSGWEEYLTGYIPTPRPSPPGGERYRVGTDKRLWKLCQEHANDLRSEKKGRHTLMLTHPFYLHLTDRHKVSSNNQEHADKYLETLLSLLSDRQTQPNVVAVDTIHHYAAATSLLVEAGLVDQVIFSEYNNGHPLEPTELRPYRTDAVFFAGGYNGRCLTDAIRDMERQTLNPTIWERIWHSLARRYPPGVWAIQELSVNVPYQLVLQPSQVNGVNPYQMVKLEAVQDILGQGR